MLILLKGVTSTAFNCRCFFLRVAGGGGGGKGGGGAIQPGDIKKGGFFFLGERGGMWRW